MGDLPLVVLAALRETFFQTPLVLNGPSLQDQGVLEGMSGQVVFVPSAVSLFKAVRGL